MDVVVMGKLIIIIIIGTFVYSVKRNGWSELRLHSIHYTLLIIKNKIQ